MFTPAHIALANHRRALLRCGMSEEHADRLLSVETDDPSPNLRLLDLDIEVWARLLAALGEGQQLKRAAEMAGVPLATLKAVRRRNPVIERQVLMAAAVGGTELRGMTALECPGEWCGTATGYHYGCGLARCRDPRVAKVLEARRRAEGRATET